MKVLLCIAALAYCFNICRGTANIEFDSWAHGRAQLQDINIHFRYAGSGPPLLLVHGNPQHSLTWRIIGPLLTDHFTVIAPDNRGMGESSLPRLDNYTAEAMGDDLQGLLDFLHLESVFVFSHDKGCGPAAALAVKNSSLVKAAGFSEYGLPGYGYEDIWTPTPDWDLRANWQLAFFAVPDLAAFFITGREKEMLAWYFYHNGYAGHSAVPEDILDRYVTSIKKPGFLRSMLGPFAAHAVGEDNAFFARTLRQNPLEMPVLALGGESSLGTIELLEQIWGPVGTNVTTGVIPKAGHWIADENPKWVADRILSFFSPLSAGIPPANLSWLDGSM